MALTKRGEWWYGDSQADIRDELARFGDVNEYLPTHFADAKCKCGFATFKLLVDEDEGVAIRICTACGSEHAMGDSDEYLEEANPEETACVCGGEVFEITVGVSLYDESEDVRWLYVGCRCPTCGLTGCFGDWKNEYIGYQEFLAKI